MSEREKKLEQLGFSLDQVAMPAALYRALVVDGTTAYASGALPIDGGKLIGRGKVPSEVSVAVAQRYAALAAANILRVVRQELGTLERVERVLRLSGYVNSEPDFTDQHIVINGASQLLIDVFGEAGFHARSAIGTAQLPLGASVEVELILKVRP